MPTGGPRDTVPPLLVGTYPDYQALNYNGKEVRLTFNEYIIPDLVSEMMVVSPPLEKRPTILTKSRTLIVRFNESLKDSLTYSMDFKNSIVDNNESNPYEGLRFMFSTGNQLDTLRIAGQVMNSFNMERLENVLVLLHRNLHDSAVYTVQPDYIARTDEQGMFFFDNLAEGRYNIFSLNDMNNNMLYDEGAEEVAFHDSILVPSAEFHAEIDTLATGADSLLMAGHTHFLPEPVYLKQFTEHIFEQYLKTSRRDSKDQFTLVFNEPVADTFNVNLVGIDYENWYIQEPNQKFDSITFWITDTTLSAKELLPLELTYFQVDSAGALYLEKDTVELQFATKDDSKRRRRDRDSDDDTPPPIPQFTFNTNLSSSGFDLNKDILITTPQPLQSFNVEGVNLYHADDTLKTPLNIKFAPDSVAWRTYRLSYPWEDETSYILQIDSAASVNIYGLTNRELVSNFKTRARDYYGTITIEASGVDGQIIMQVLENNDNEAVLQEKIITDNETISFNYLAPEKYRIKAIYDRNKNGVWDAGSYQEKYQPEKVVYINEVIKVRSNWENNLPWDLTPDPSFVKNIRDRELEEQLRKEAEEKAEQEEEQNNMNEQQQQDNLFQPGGMSLGSFQPGR